MTGGDAALDLPLAFTRFWVGAFGLVVGSFLNVVIHRVPRGESVVTPRSRCPGCGRGIRWHENIPILSWILLRGRCAGCRSPISWRYPAIEALTGLLFVLCHEAFGFGPSLAVAAAFAAATVALIVIDFEHMLLPDAITLPLAFLGLAATFVPDLALTTPEDALLGVLIAWFVLEGMNLAYKLVRGRDGFGGGDTKMMMMVGAFLGWRMTLFTFVGGSLLGTLVGLPLWALARRHLSRADAPGAPGEPEPPPEGPGEPGPDEETQEPSPSWRDLMPRSLDETLPLVVVPSCAAAWLLPGGSPERALAGLLVGVALAAAAAWALRGRGLDSPLSRALPIVGALAGLPPRAVPLLAGAAVVAALLAWFRPAAVAPRPEAEPEPPPTPREPGESLMQSELPFGVFLGAAALVALLAGDAVLDAYLRWSAEAFAPPLEP